MRRSSPGPGLASTSASEPFVLAARVSARLPPEPTGHSSGDAVAVHWYAAREAQLNMATVLDIRSARPASRWDAVCPRALQRGEALFALVSMEKEVAGRVQRRNNRDSCRPG